MSKPVRVIEFDIALKLIRDGEKIPVIRIMKGAAFVSQWSRGELISFMQKSQIEVADEKMRKMGFGLGSLDEDGEWVFYGTK